MRRYTSVAVLVLTAVAVARPVPAQADERNESRFSVRSLLRPSALPSPLLQAQSSYEAARKSGLIKIIAGSAMAGVGVALVASSRTTLTYVNGELVDTERSPRFWGGIALGGAGAALIVFGARQRINAFQPEIAVPFGRSERSALVFGIGRRPTASYRFGW
jgi:hypothetical protein